MVMRNRNEIVTVYCAFLSFTLTRKNGLKSVSNKISSYSYLSPTFNTILTWNWSYGKSQWTVWAASAKIYILISIVRVCLLLGRQGLKSQEKVFSIKFAFCMLKKFQKISIYSGLFSRKTICSKTIFGHGPILRDIFCLASLFNRLKWTELQFWLWWDNRDQLRYLSGVVEICSIWARRVWLVV